MKYTQLILLFLTAFLSAAHISSAQRTVTGKVTSAETGEPLVGTSVRVKGTTSGAITDGDGKYSVSVPRSYTILEFSYSGYQAIQKTLDDSNVLNVALGEDGQLKEVVVTSDLNATRTKINSPLPVDLIPIQNIVRQAGQVDLAQILTYIAPSFQSARQTIADGTDHLDPAQLRGLGPDQVLVLINGKRRHQSALVNVNGTVNRGTVGTDLNAIPASAIHHIEILRDGAAAIYGSDAIAGVINIITKGKDNKGLDISVSSGINSTAYDKALVYNTLNNLSGSQSVRVSDGLTYQIGANWGRRFGEKGERGFFNLTGEYTFRDRTNRAGIYTGQLYPDVSGKMRDDSILSAKRLTRDVFDMRIGNSRVRSGSIFLNTEYLVAEGWTLYGFGGFNQKNGNASGFYRYPSTILASYRAREIYPDGFLPEINSDVTDLALTAGIKGKWGEWDVDMSQTIGQNRFAFEVDNSVNYTQSSTQGITAQRAFDCGGLRFRQLTTNAGVKRNFSEVMSGLFIALGAEFRSEGFKQRAGEAASWKNYDPVLSVPPIPPGAQVFAGFRPEFAIDTARTNFAGYVDAEIDFTDKFMAGAALRLEKYSDFGWTLNYKLVSRYKITDGFSLRGSFSTGFRAPSLQQQFYGRTSTVFVGQPLMPLEAGTYPNNSALATAFGIRPLHEETSLSYGIGITAHPAEGLELTLDAYQTNIDGRIVLTNNFGANGNPDLAARLAAVGADKVNFFTNAVNTRSRGIEAAVSYSTPRFGANNQQKLVFVFSGSLIHNEVEKGADSKALLIDPSPIIVATGQLGSYFNREDQSRIEVASPRQKANLTINYEVGKFSVMLRNTYWGAVKYIDPLDINDPTTWQDPKQIELFKNQLNGNKPESFDQTFSSKVVTDLTLIYDLIPKRLSLAVGANNLFDVYPDSHAHSANFSAGRFVYSRRVQQFGFNGRYIFARLRFVLGGK